MGLAKSRSLPFWIMCESIIFLFFFLSKKAIRLQILAKVGLAKVGLAKVGQVRMAKVGLAKVGLSL